MFAVIRLLFVAMTAAVVLAAPASADQSEYLRQLAPSYAYLTSSQLVREGAIACSVAGTGRPMSDAVPVIQKDLRGLGAPAISTSVGIDIAAAAAVYLGC